MDNGTAYAGLKAGNLSHRRLLASAAEAAFFALLVTSRARVRKSNYLSHTSSACAAIMPDVRKFGRAGNQSEKQE
jgi:hypothetical protein